MPSSAAHTVTASFESKCVEPCVFGFPILLPLLWLPWIALNCSSSCTCCGLIFLCLIHPPTIPHSYLIFVHVRVWFFLFCLVLLQHPLYQSNSREQCWPDILTTTLRPSLSYASHSRVNDEKAAQQTQLTLLYAIANFMEYLWNTTTRLAVVVLP